MAEQGYKKRWAELLEEAVTKPGRLHECYNAFHGYSIGNQFLALIQCYERGLEVGPLASYKAWLAKGRQVQRGQKALSLWMPITLKDRERDENGEMVETGDKVTIFRLLPRWFVYSQTEGDAIEPQPEISAWSLDAALAALDIKRLPFDILQGNPQGFAKPGGFAVNPMAVNPIKTTVHEIAHLLLGHLSEGGLIVDGEKLARSMAEVEAESVALIVLDALGLPGQEYARGYIQEWYYGHGGGGRVEVAEGDAIPERSARRIFAAADKVLKAGIAEPVKEVR